MFGFGSGFVWTLRLAFAVQGAGFEAMFDVRVSEFTFRVTMPRFHPRKSIDSLLLAQRNVLQNALLRRVWPNSEVSCVAQQQSSITFAKLVWCWEH